MRARLKVSRAGVELIKSFEGLRPVAAKLPDGRWTLGYGHTLSAREGAQVTADDAEALLRFDLLPVVEAVNMLVTVPLNQNQFDALVSFSFNIGVDNFKSSLVLKRLNEGLMAEAALAMDSWRSAEYNGETYVLAPLIRRRNAEKALFATPVEPAVSAAAAPPVEAVAVFDPSFDEARLLAEAAAAAEAEKKGEQDAREQAARVQAEAEAAQRRVEDENRVREEALKQTEALAAARLAAEAAAAEAAAAEAAQETIRQAEAKEAEDKRLAEEKHQAEQARLAEDSRLAQEAAEKEAAIQAQAQAQPVAQSQPPVDEDAEKARKAEAAAALMRLYSPYGVGVRGSLVAPQKSVAPEVAPIAPVTPEPPTLDLAAARPVYTPPVSASLMPAPVVAVLSSVAAVAAVAPIVESVTATEAKGGFEPQPEAEPVFHAEPVAEAAPVHQPELEPVPEPAVEVPAVPEPVVPAPVTTGLHWREQLQRPLPQNYQPQDHQPLTYQPSHEAPVAPQPTHDFMQPPASAASSFTESYAEEPEDWMLDGGRIALSSEEMEEEGVSWWKMIVSTMNWILLSCFGLACLGVASAAWWMGRNDPAVARLGHIQNYTMVSIITAIAGILFVSISVWLIMKRLGGLKD